MARFYFAVRRRQTRGDFLDDVDGAMLTARATNGYGQVRALKVLIVRNPPTEKRDDIVDHLLDGSVAAQESAHGFVLPAQMS